MYNTNTTLLNEDNDQQRSLHRMGILASHLNPITTNNNNNNNLFIQSNQCSASKSSPTTILYEHPNQQQSFLNRKEKQESRMFGNEQHYLDLPSNESLHRYHLMLKRQDRAQVQNLNTKSIKSLRAFHSKDSTTLASRLLQSSEMTMFDKGYAHTREQMLKVLNEDQYVIDNEWNVHQFRQQLDTQFHEFIKNNLITTQIMNDNIYAFLGALEPAMNYEVSFAAKLVVSLQLYGTCIYKLGTERHRYLLDDLNSAKDIGCFMLTEIAHGSNVRGIETTATFDSETKEFVIHSPTESSYKYWIGNSAVYGTKSCVFAQLYVNNENKGVHAFVVPIRDQKTLEMYPGITIKDIGVKQGWNAVDNGCIKFDKVRVPLGALLNKYGDVTSDGQYVSSIKNEGARFGITLSALSMGRLLYIAGPTHALKTGLTTAIRYAHQRRQFGEKDKETLIWDYPTHQDMMMPMIAMAHAFFSGCSTLADEYSTLDHNNMESFHAIVSGIKAYSCEYVTPALRDLRVSCGGHGYSNNNRIGILMNDMDVFNTAEGDATVLYQQVTKFLLEKSKKNSGSNPVLKLIASVGAKADSKSNVLSFDFQSKALAFRVKKLLGECSAEIEKYMKKDKKDFQTAWSLSMVKVIETARSYIELEL